jgi:hypothetical protein
VGWEGERALAFRLSICFSLLRCCVRVCVCRWRGQRALGIACVGELLAGVRWLGLGRPWQGRERWRGGEVERWRG